MPNSRRRALFHAPACPKLRTRSRPPAAALPACTDARRDLILRQLGPGGPIRAQLSEEELSKVVARTEGYSG